MADVLYTQEQIEEKRRLALQRRQAKLQYNIQSKGLCKRDCDSTSDQKFKTFLKNGPVTTGTCTMINNNRFVIKMSSYIPSHIDVYKMIPSKLYDPKTKTWSFHIDDYENLIEKFKHQQPNVCIIGIPRSILQIFRKNSSSSEMPYINLATVDKTLINSLMPFQREGVCYGISKHGRCMIADDMGLGKTIQALGIAHYYKESWPLLIVTPASVRYQWSDAIFNFLPSVALQHTYHFTSTNDVLNGAKVVIISYDLLSRAIDTIAKCVFNFIILDESHILKSSKTARFKAVQRMVNQARHVVLLSGTPALSRPIELYSQIKLISPTAIGYEEYGVRYCAGVKMPYGWNFKGASNMQELQLLLKSFCMIRRVKNDVLHQLPSKIRQAVVLDPTLVKTSTEKMVEISEKFAQKHGLERHRELLQYYNESSVIKVAAVCNYIRHLFEQRHKCLIFAHHQNVLDAICDVAESMDIRYIRIDGKTSPEQRKYQVDLFQEREDCVAAVLSITAANSGVTLTAAQLVVFAELFWNPGILHQAEDRVHRIGQKNSVNIRYLVAKDTVDDYLWPLIQRKLSVLNEAGFAQDLSLKEMDVASPSTNLTTNISQKEGVQTKLDTFIFKCSQESTSDQSSLKFKENHSFDSTIDFFAEDDSAFLDIDIDDL